MNNPMLWAFYAGAQFAAGYLLGLTFWVLNPRS